MKQHIYKLKGAGVAPELVGFELKQARPETVEDFKTLIVNGDEGRIVGLATQQFLLNCQRAAKDVAESEDCQKLVREGRVDEAKALIQKAADEYRDGGPRAPGAGAATKAKAAKVDAVAAAAASNPKLAKLLAEAGITL